MAYIHLSPQPHITDESCNFGGKMARCTGRRLVEVEDQLAEQYLLHRMVVYSTDQIDHTSCRSSGVLPVSLVLHWVGTSRLP